MQVSRTEYKMTEIGEIPKDWSAVKLGTLCSIRNYGDTKSDVYIGLEHIGQGNNLLVSKGNIKDFTSTKNSFLKGDILYGKLRPLLNKVFLAQEDGYCSTDILPLVVTDKILNKILLWNLSSERFVKYADSNSSGTKMPTTSWKDMRNFLIAIPSIKEQHKIASILSKVHGLIENTDQIIEQTKTLKKGFLQRLLTRGIGHSKFKKTTVGEIPDMWEIVKMKDLIDSYKNGIYKKSSYYGHGVLNIRMFNIQNGKVDTKNTPLLEVTKDELADYGLKHGDILLNRVNSADLVGKSGILERDIGPAVFDSMIIRIRVLKDLCIPEFLNYFLNTNAYFKQIEGVIKHAIGQSSLNQEDLNQLIIFLH